MHDCGACVCGKLMLLMMIACSVAFCNRFAAALAVNENARTRSYVASTRVAGAAACNILLSFSPPPQKPAPPVTREEIALLRLNQVNSCAKCNFQHVDRVTFQVSSSHGQHTRTCW